MEKTPTQKFYDPRRILYSKKVAPYVFTLPFILSFLILFCYPMFTTITMSLQNVENGFEFVWLKNYQTLLQTPIFYTALKNSAVYTLMTLAVLIIRCR